MKSSTGYPRGPELPVYTSPNYRAFVCIQQQYASQGLAAYCLLDCISLNPAADAVPLPITLAKGLEKLPEMFMSQSRSTIPDGRLARMCSGCLWSPGLSMQSKSKLPENCATLCPERFVARRTRQRPESEVQQRPLRPCMGC